MHQNLLFTVILGWSLATTAIAVANQPTDWPSFHGASNRGYVPGGTLPNAWQSDDYRWRRPLDSTDVGSPIIVHGAVYYLTADPESNEIVLESLKLETGQLRWEKRYPLTPYRIHKRNTIASSTPVADKDQVLIAYAEPDHTFLKCLDHEGNELWSRDFGPWQSQHGFGTSPMIVGSMVVLMNSQQADRLNPGESPGQSRMIAVDRITGETIWQTPLKTTRACYGVPAVNQTSDGRLQLIGANTGNGIFALDAMSGKMLWNVPVFSKRCCSSPLIVDDLAIGTCGSGGGGNELVAVKIPASETQQPTEAYRINRAAPYVPTPTIRDGHLFTIADNGIASCIDVGDGSVVWSERIGGKFGASPIIIGDKLLAIDLGGIATILAAGDRFERLGRVDLDGPVGASPAYSNGHLILRVGDEIRCLGE